MPFLHLTSAIRTSLSLTALVVLTACGGGGSSDPDPVSTADLNPSLTSSTVPAALPNATKLVAATFTSTTGDFTTTVGAKTYTYNLTGSDNVTLTGNTNTNYTLWDAGGRFLMLCRKTAPDKADAVIAAPYLTAATPAKPEELVGKTFVAVEGCAEDTSVPPVTYNSDGTAVATNGSQTVTISKADLSKYFTDIGLKDGNDVYRGHIYKVTAGSDTVYVIIETYKENGVENIAMWVED